MEQLTRNRKRFENLASLFIGTIISCFIGFFNKYPLVYPDTGAYLASGFNTTLLQDRPIFYGLFARHISLSASPWLIIFVQSLIVSWLIYEFVGMFLKGTRRNLIFIGTILLLTLTTGYSFNVSILLPDIFCACSLLAFALLVFSKDKGILKKILLSVIFVFGLSTHLSNYPTFGLIMLSLLTFGLLKSRKGLPPIIEPKALLLPGLLFVGSILMVQTTNYALGGRYELSSGSDIFIVGHFREIGVLEQYLKDECANKDYKICAYQEDLGWDFLWSEESALYKTGGWEANREDFEDIVSGIITGPRYWPMLLQKGIEYSFKQMFTFETTIASPQLNGSPPYGQIYWHFRDSVMEYIGSKQSNDLFDLTIHNYAQTLIILLSGLFILSCMLFQRLRNELPTLLYGCLYVVLLYGLFNAVINGNLSTVDPRYANRWVWILPMLAILVIIALRLRIRSLIDSFQDAES